jgi:hypothetical protein
MAATTRIIFQPYTRGKRGGVASGQAVVCRNQDEARRRAEKALAGGQAIGGHIVRVMVDEDAGDYGEPEFLTVFGTVPDVG